MSFVGFPLDHLPFSSLSVIRLLDHIESHCRNVLLFLVGPQFRPGNSPTFVVSLPRVLARLPGSKEPHHQPFNAEAASWW